MAVLPLIIEPDERLHIPSARIETVSDEVRQLASDMLETMYAHNGIGLAAVQVGVHQKLIVVDVEWPSPRYDDDDARDTRESNPIVMINPQIIESSSETSVFNEGCLSFPDHYSQVKRPAHVTIGYMDLDGNTQTLQADELLSTCVQHEIDHTNGIVFTDHISKLKREMIIRKLKKAKKLGILPELKNQQPAGM